MSINYSSLTKVISADVYKGRDLAAQLRRVEGGVEFSYFDEYMFSQRRPVATSLPLDSAVKNSGGAVPPFFAGLLPEGRRLTGLRTAIKTSADDELSLLLGVGADVVGDVSILPSGQIPYDPEPLLSVGKRWGEIDFSIVLDSAQIIDPIGFAGVQDKVSARMISTPVKGHAVNYILKLSPPEFPGVVENESFFIGVAKDAGVPVVDAQLVSDATGRSGLLVRRFDRKAEVRLACEDACQVSNRWPADKYLLSAEAVAENLSAVCSARTLALRDIYRQFVFAWLTGNGDVHAKNLSVIQNESGEWRVAPAYDIPNSTVYGDQTFAVAVQGERSGLSRKKFLNFANGLGLNAKVAVGVIDELLDKTTNMVDKLRAADLPFSQKTTADLVAQLKNRRRSLQQAG